MANDTGQHSDAATGGFRSALTPRITPRPPNDLLRCGNALKHRYRVDLSQMSRTIFGTLAIAPKDNRFAT